MQLKHLHKETMVEEIPSRWYVEAIQDTFIFLQMLTPKFDHLGHVLGPVKHGIGGR